MPSISFQLFQWWTVFSIPSRGNWSDSCAWIDSAYGMWRLRHRLPHWTLSSRVEKEHQRYLQVRFLLLVFHCFSLPDDKNEITISDNIDPTAPQESTPIPCLNCKQALVKPRTVLYGRSLPSSFFKAVEVDFDTQDEEVDLVLILGTSLVVGPANQIPMYAPPSCPRILINMEDVSSNVMNWDSKKDHFLSGAIDDVVNALVSEVGWQDQLSSLSENFSHSFEMPEKE